MEYDEMVKINGRRSIDTGMYIREVNRIVSNIVRVVFSY